MTKFLLLVLFCLPCAAANLPHTGGPIAFRVSGALNAPAPKITAPDWVHLSVTKLTTEDNLRFVRVTGTVDATTTPRQATIKIEFGISLQTFSVNQSGEMRLNKDGETKQFSVEQIERAWFIPDSATEALRINFSATATGVFFRLPNQTGWLYVDTIAGRFSYCKRLAP